MADAPVPPSASRLIEQLEKLRASALALEAALAAALAAIPAERRASARNLIHYLQSGVVTNMTLPVELVVRRSA